MRRFLLDHRTENARHRVWIERAGIVDANGAIDAHCQRGADLFIDRRHSDRDAHDFRRFAAFANPQRLLDCDLVEWVDHRFRRRDHCARDGDVVSVGHTLERNEDLHLSTGAQSQFQEGITFRAPHSVALAIRHCFTAPASRQ